jgi:hypothetical protein
LDLKAVGRDRPPSVPFVFAVGVTGHRKDALAPAALLTVHERLRTVLQSLVEKAKAVHTADQQFFTADPPRLLFVSALADGADQLAAEVALNLGFELHAVLPFDRDRYRAGMADDASRTRFDDLLARATCSLELPGGGGDDLDAYVLAGRATVAHSDVIIAVWDGLPPRGRGGTGEVVSLAHERGTPIVHVPVEATGDTMIRWTAFEPNVVTQVDDPANVRPFDEMSSEAVVSAILAPPPDQREREFLLTFLGERPRAIRPRIEYPLLLAATGISPLRRHHWRADLASKATTAEWQSHSAACERAQAASAPMGPLEQSYAWSDSLAAHFAQSFRSGHVFNFVFAALAVFLGTANLILPGWAIFLEVGLFFAVLAIIANTWAANRGQWHRRWLDYRQLAERLRPMRSLKVLAIAAPDPPGTAANPMPQRWIEWYAARAWQAVGCPAGRIDASRLGALSTTIADKEVQPQVDYHRRAALQLGRLNHRLEVLGYSVFTLALVSSAFLITGFAVAPDWVHRNYNWFTVISATLPAIGTAVVGIRVQGDHSASAIRSQQTSVVLEHVAQRLRGESSGLVRAADLTEQAARAMLADLDEWRLLNQQHELSIG